MKILLIFSLLINVCIAGQSQTTGDILKREAGEGVKEGANAATQKTADKVLGKIFGKKSKNNNNNNSSADNQNNNKNVTANQDIPTGSTASSGKENHESPSLKTYSKYDFVAGEKIVAFEDFSQDAVGDFPDKWNTNSTGEIVTIEGQAGHWLALKKQGLFVPEFVTSLPENFTLEFDLVVNSGFNYYSDLLQLYLIDGDNGKKLFDGAFIQSLSRSGVQLAFHPNNGTNGGSAKIMSFETGQTVINNQMQTDQFYASGGKNKVKVSIWRQKQRIRMYLNEEKIMDAPRAFLQDKKYQTIVFQIPFDLKPGDQYLISNIKLAVGAPDTRNKLLTEGKFSTTGILFDVNSDKIKPESYGVLKEIAVILQDNNNLKIKIIGHTDSDGDAANNLDLSKRRAVAVKNILGKEFNIDEQRMETDGKGEQTPVASNNSPEGKAQNRRVEFIKE